MSIVHLYIEYTRKHLHAWHKNSFPYVKKLAILLKALRHNPQPFGISPVSSHTLLQPFSAIHAFIFPREQNDTNDHAEARP